MFITLLTSIINTPNHKKYVFSSNQQRTTQPTLVDLHPNEYIPKLHYHIFAVNLDRHMRSYNTLNKLSNRVCVPNKTEDLKILENKKYLQNMFMQM